MSRQYSPFAALTSREQQERWLEFQNTKLPYIRGEVDSIIDPDIDFGEIDPQPSRPTIPPKSAPQPTATQTGASQPASFSRPENAEAEPSRPQPEMPSQQVLQSFQKTNHKQYDAIIRRMMDAGKQTSQFQSVQ